MRVFTLALLAAACGGGGSDGTSPAEPADTTTTPPPQSTSAAGSPATSTLSADVELATAAWPTDWEQKSIDIGELKLGINTLDPRDVIRPLDNPQYEPVSDVAWLVDREIGLSLEIDGSARFYPLRILTAHEIVNDEVVGVPYAVTYCPLCNTAVVFDRRVGERTLRFGVSGLLRNSDLVMWDDATVSLWQQIVGEGIVGEFSGTKLTVIPSSMIRWIDFATTHPEGEVLSRNTGLGYAYESNAYVGYSDRAAPFAQFFDAELDTRYPALERVVGVRIGDSSKAFPFSELASDRVVDDDLGGSPITVWWAPTDAADNFDGSAVGSGRSIGTGIAFSRQLDGDVLTFEASGSEEFTDLETGSTWSILGLATSGPLSGSRLSLVPHQNEFWFAWSAFNADAPVYTG